MSGQLFSFRENHGDATLMRMRLEHAKEILAKPVTEEAPAEAIDYFTEAQKEIAPQPTTGLLISAIRTGADLATIESLIESNLDQVPDALYQAFIYGRTEAAKLFLAHPAGIEACRGPCGESLLWLACEDTLRCDDKKTLEFLELFLSLGASRYVNSVDNGETLFYSSCGDETIAFEKAKLLVKYGVDLDAISVEGVWNEEIKNRAVANQYCTPEQFEELERIEAARNTTPTSRTASPFQEAAAASATAPTTSKTESDLEDEWELI